MLWALHLDSHHCIGNLENGIRKWRRFLPGGQRVQDSDPNKAYSLPEIHLFGESVPPIQELPDSFQLSTSYYLWGRVCTPQKGDRSPHHMKFLKLSRKYSHCTSLSRERSLLFRVLTLSFEPFGSDPLAMVAVENHGLFGGCGRTQPPSCQHLY